MSGAFHALSDFVRLHARGRPHDIAFVCDDSTLSWRDLNDDVDRMAASLRDQGAAPGSRVGLLATNSIWAYTAMLAILRTGASLVPCSPLLTPSMLATKLADCGAVLLLVGRGLETLAAQAGCACLDETTLEAAPPRRFEAPCIAPDDECNVIYSSGTTGRPKGIVHTHGCRIRMGFDVGLAFGFARSCRSLITTPPHTNGTMICLLPTIIAGGTAILLPRFNADSFFAALDRHAPTHAFLVPTMFQGLFDDPRIETAKLDSFVALISAGSPIPSLLRVRMLQRLGDCLYELWGVTEGVATVCPASVMRNDIRSVGHPLPSTQLGLVDEEDGVGEIVGTSPYLMDFYLGRAADDRDSFWFDAQGTRFVRTGDMGAITSDGALQLHGRKKEMIISGGLNVFPIDIEAALSAHPAVRDAAVVAMPHEKWGEVPFAFICLRDGVACSEEQLLVWSAERLAKHQRLAGIRILQGDLPRNALGKVEKTSLAARLQEMCA